MQNTKNRVTHPPNARTTSPHAILRNVWTSLSLKTTRIHDNLVVDGSTFSVNDESLWSFAGAVPLRSKIVVLLVSALLADSSCCGGNNNRGGGSLASSGSTSFNDDMMNSMLGTRVVFACGVTLCCM